MTIAARNEPQFLWVAEPALRLQLSAPTVRRTIHGGRLRAVQLTPGGWLRIPVAELERLAADAKEDERT